MLQYYLDNHYIKDKKNIIFNVGANTGQEIEVLKDLSCEIHAFEPHPLIFENLKKNYGNRENIILNETAAWNKNQNKNLYFKKSKEAINGGASLIIHKGNISKHIKTIVKCIDIAEYIEKENSQIDLFWMDVEGAEYDIISHLIKKGSIKKIQNHYFEDHERRFKNFKKFGSYLYGLYYIMRRKIILKKLKDIGFDIKSPFESHYILSKKS